MKMEKNKISKNIWSEDALSFMKVVHHSQKNVLHPSIAELINLQNPERMLDFGCGDGRLLKMLNKGPLIDLYDKNPEMTEMALANTGEIINHAYYNIKEIPDDYYDAVVLSMVLVCIDNKPEYAEVLNKISQAKKNKGLLYIAVTHPCFRDRYFSNFNTSFGRTQEYNYLKEGTPFNVHIEDPEPPDVSFTDYHWTLSFTINNIIKEGMNIKRIIELPDDYKHDKPNKNFSTFMLIIAE